MVMTVAMRGDAVGRARGVGTHRARDQRRHLQWLHRHRHQHHHHHHHHHHLEQKGASVVRGSSLMDGVTDGDSGSGGSGAAVVVAIVTTASCPHCARAKKALANAGVAYEEINVDDAPALRAASAGISGFRSVPQVFVGGEIFGGADDTCEGLRTGMFMEKVEAASGSGTRGAPPALEEAYAAHKAGTLKETTTPAAVGPSAPATASTTSWYSPTGTANVAATAKAMADGSTGVKRTTVRRFNGFTDGLFQVIKTHDGVFTAEAAVEWLMENKKASSVDAATTLGAKMLENKLIVDVDATNAFVMPSPSPPPLFRFQADAAVNGNAPLNVASVYVGEAREAKIVVEDVRRRILKLYDEFLSSDGRAVDYDGIRSSNGFKEFVKASEELQRVNLNGLSREERLAFFINVYNALVIHGTCVFGTPKNTLERLSFFSKTSYNIGGHTYTCDDIENGVLRGNRPGAATLGALLGNPSLSRGPFRAGDPRRYNVVLPMDPRIHFALVCGARSCPPIRVYTSKDIDRELEDAAFSFFESEIDVVTNESGEAASAAVSKIVGEWYKFDFGASDAERLRYVSAFMKAGTAKDALIKALDDGKDVPLTTRAYDWTLNDGK